MADKIEVHAERDIIGNGHAVFIVQGNQIARMELTPFMEGTKVEASIAGRRGSNFLQAALDCAWVNGMRPAGFSDTTEQVRAMGRHLEDMRAITFAKINVEKP